MYEISIALAAAILISAAISDIRKREVSDIHWYALFVIGIVKQSIELDFLSVIGILSLGVYVFTEYYPKTSLVISAISFIVSGDYQILIMSFMMIALYHLGVIRGGADAKAIISISVAFPFYPNGGVPFPAAYLLSPAFTVLLLALILSISVAFYNLYMSSKNGKIDVSGYEMEINIAKKKFVWPTEDIVDGKKTRVGTADEDAYERLTEAGYEKVRVTPMIPFVLPIAISFIIVMLIGWSPLDFIQNAFYRA